MATQSAFSDEFVAHLLDTSKPVEQPSPEPTGTGEVVTSPKIGRAPVETLVDKDEDIASNGMWNWTPEQIAEYAIGSKGRFSPKHYATAHADFFRANPELRQKLADAHGVLASRNLIDKTGDIVWGDVIKGLGHFAKGVVTAGGHYSEQLDRKGFGIPFVNAPFSAADEFAQAKAKGLSNKEAGLRAAERVLPRAVFKRLFKQDTPEQKAALDNFFKKIDAENFQQEMEIFSAYEGAQTGFVDMARRGGRTLLQQFGAVKNWQELSPEDRLKRFDFDTAIQQQINESAEGKGVATRAISGGEAEKVVRPKVVAEMTAADPSVLMSFGGTAKVITGAPGAIFRATPAGAQLARAGAAAEQAGVARGIAANAERLAAGGEQQAGRAAVQAFEAGTPEAIAQAEAAQTAAGVQRAGAGAANVMAENAAARATQAAEAVGPTGRYVASRQAMIQAGMDRAGELLRSAGRGAGRVAAGAPTYAAGAGLTGAGYVSKFVSSFFPPIIVPRAVGTGAGLAIKGGRALRAAGGSLVRQSPAEMGRVGQLVSDISASIGETAVEFAKGAAVDVVLGGLVAEDPAEWRGLPMFFGAVKGLGGAGRGARRVLGGQLVGARNARLMGSEFQPTARRNYGTFPEFDQSNAFSLRGQPPEVTQRFGAIRSFVEQFGGEAYYVPNEAVLRDALLANGVEPGLVENIVRQQGAMVPMPDGNGNVRNVVFVRNLEAGPHEGGHVLEMVMPEEQVRMLRDDARRNYGRVFEQDAVRYTEDMLGRQLRAGERWQDLLVENTGGATEARLRGRTVDELASDIIADEYIAENIDTAVKAQGPGMERSKLGNWTMQALLKLGLGDMVLGESATQGVPVTPRSFESARNAARTTASEFNRPRFGGEGERMRRGAPRRPVDDIVEPNEPGAAPEEPGAEPAPAPTPRGPRGGPRAEDSVQTARDIADELRANGQRREAAIMDEVADAIANDEGILIDYAAAQGRGASEPAALRNIRRAEIELGRLPDAIREQVQHMLFPTRVTRTRSRGPQVIGWSPTVYMANAQRLAAMLAELQRRGVDIREFTPYEIDPRTRSFTADAWEQLIADAEQFSRNQLAGATGAGEPLVVPQRAQELGAFPPEVREGRAGTEQPLPQETADFHNMLFNFRLPDTPRMSRGGAPLNVLGQEVSQATQAGRLSVPVEPRGQYTGDRARALGIEGREIMEVNPLRGELERVAAEHGQNLPQMIEVIQRLNLEHIADTTPAPGIPGYGRGNTLTLSAGFQPGRNARRARPMSELPRPGHGRHIWLDPNGKFFDAEGNHRKFAEDWTGNKDGNAAMNELLEQGWVRVNPIPALGVFAETAPGKGFRPSQTRALEDVAFQHELPVLNKKGRVAIGSTGDFMKNTQGSVFFQPSRRRGKAMELRPSPRGERMSKAFILPNGEPVQLGSQLHEAYLKTNAAELASRFKMKSEAFKGGEADARAEALRSGAIRINHNSGTGHVTIEATREGWKRNRAAVEEFVLENMDKFDSAEVALFDKTGRKEMDYDTVRFGEVDGPEKFTKFPLLNEEARSSAVANAREKIGGMFYAQPEKAGVEAIKAASIRWKPTGEVFEGMMHAMATDQLLQSGKADAYLGQKVRSFEELGDGELWNKFMDQVEDGYTTTERPFITRAEAVDVGKQSGQLDTRSQAKIAMREEKFGVKGVDSSEVSTLRDQQIAAETGSTGNATIGRAHGDPTLSAQPQRLPEEQMASIIARAVRDALKPEAAPVPEKVTADWLRDRLARSLPQDEWQRPDLQRLLKKLDDEAEAKGTTASFQPSKDKITKPAPDVTLMPDASVSTSVPTAVGKGVTAKSASSKLTLADKLNRTGADATTKRWNTYLNKVVDSVNKMPGFRDVTGTLEERYNQIVDRIAENLKHLWEISPEAERQLHSQWYWFANGMSNRWGGEFGHQPRAVAAVNAIFSPQKDWYENVSMTRKALETFKQDPVLKQEHVDYTDSVISQRKAKWKLEKGKALVAKMQENVGKKLSELDNEAASGLMRAEVDLYGERSLIDHDMNPVAKTDSGRTAFVWQQYETIEGAISVLRDQSVENISSQLGNNHKVRSFYDNHVNPQDATAQPVTIDTHATAAGALVPYGAASPEVKATFGNPKNSEEGYYGTYPLWSDGYRKAATDLGIEFPLELQSITWERIRRIVDPGKKRSLQKVIKNDKGVTVNIEFPEIESIWARAEKGEITRQQAREEIIEVLSTPTKAKQKAAAKAAGTKSAQPKVEKQ